MDPALTHHVLFDFAWVSSPSAWVGLLTLAAIEIVLGIDNLLFIAVLSQRLPPKERSKACYIGIGGALVIRLILLTLAAYIAAITTPLFTLFGYDFTVRDLVMLGGGLFLIYKSTVDLHQKLEGSLEDEAVIASSGAHSLAVVAIQIMVLDAVFSVDAIVTSVGMTDHVFIMMAAVIISMGVMVLASGIVTDIVSRHPTLVILCLGFVILIGFSLILEALGIEVPKGYLYAAIGFSVIIEIFNEIARRNVLHLGSTRSMQSRELAANLVLRLLGSRQSEVPTLKEAIVQNTGAGVFNQSEKDMVARVLGMSSIPVKAVMCARNDLECVMTDAPAEEILETASRMTHSRLIACLRDRRDQPEGYISRADILALGVERKVSQGALTELVKQPLYFPETVNILKALEEFRNAKKYIGFVFDEFGNFEGIVTLHDIMEEISGDLPDQAEIPEVVRVSPGSYRIDGEAVLQDVARVTGFKVPPSEHYTTMAGFILDYLQRVPEVGEKLSFGTWRLEILKADETSIEAVKLTSGRAPQILGSH